MMSNFSESVIALLDDTPAESLKRIAANLRERRERLNISREGLAERSGVPPSTIRKFELTGQITLESFLKLANCLETMTGIVAATEPPEEHFETMDDLIAANRARTPSRRKRPYNRRKGKNGE